MVELTAEDELAVVTAELSEVESSIQALLARQQHLQAQRERLSRTVTENARAPKADWQGSFAWDQEVEHLLHESFGLQDFRPLQREIINAVLQGRDVLCLLPSGGGKSLCYQLPALTGKGVTLVVSPLLSLIHDQVLGLEALGIKALALTSMTPKEQITRMYQQMENDSDVRLVYATPERIVGAKRFMGKLEKLYKAGRLDRIAIDEAHCCSQWGNDFRPDYKKLGVLKQQFPDVPIMALTATATQRVCEDLKAMLRIEACENFTASINRPNLQYEVHAKPKAAPDQISFIVDWISNNVPHSESGIVYCLTRKDTEQVASQLAQQGLACGCYHADMDPLQRETVHMQWTTGRLQLIVATIAFGMGINKPDVRFVIHHSLSKSLENYYQESGRAGRDGQPARCLLLYRFSDALRQAAIVNFEPTWQANLFAMMQYAAALSTCRRAALSRHFAEAPASCNNMCDNCQRHFQVDMTDAAAAAQLVVHTLQNLPAADKRLTLTQLIESCRKSKRNDAVKQMSPDDCELLIAKRVYSGVLQIDFGFTAYATTAYLKCSSRASFLVAGKEFPLETLPEQQQTAPQVRTTAASTDVQRNLTAKSVTGRKHKRSSASAEATTQAPQSTEVVEISDDDDFAADFKLSRH